MNFSIDELQRFALNGTLEQHILSNGLLPLQILQHVLESGVCVEEELHDQVENLVDKVQDLEDKVEMLEDEKSTLISEVDGLQKALHAERNPPF